MGLTVFIFIDFYLLQCIMKELKIYIFPKIGILVKKILVGL